MEHLRRNQTQHNGSFPIYVGGERFRTTLRMYFQTMHLIFRVLLVLWPLIFWGAYEITVSGDEQNALVATAKAKWFSVMDRNRQLEVVLDGKPYYGTPEQILKDPGVSELKGKAITGIKWSAILSALAMIPIGLLLGRYLVKKADDFRRKHVRGPQLLDGKEVAKQIRKERLPAVIPLSPLVRLPVRDEVMNVLVAGAPGVGKTVFFSQTLDLIRRDHKVICHDFKGDYVGRFYDPETDIIFNPADKRSVPWRLFNEIRNVLDLQAVSHSLIPMSFGEGRFWNDGAREVLSGLLRCLYKSDKTTNRDIWTAVSSKAADVKSMLVEADALAGAKFIEDASSKQALGILSTLMQYAACFEFLKDTEENNDFSLMNWLTNGRGGTIYITNYVDCQDVLRPMLSLTIDLLARRVLSLPDSIDNRVYFILDEFSQLQSLSSIERLLTTARSKGGSVWIGIQDISQVRKRYGQEGAQTILNSCGTSIIFRSPDPDTGEYFSRRIGITEYDKYDSNFSISPEDIGDRQQMAMRHITEPLVSPAQIQHLPNLEAYVSMIGKDIFQTRFNFRAYPQINESFVMRDGLDIPLAKGPAPVESPRDDKSEEISPRASRGQEPMDLSADDVNEDKKEK